MHTLHHIAIQANSPEEAFDMVKTALQESDRSPADWSDWCVIGGGRWHSKGQDYQYDEDPSDVLCYADDPEKFIKIVNNSVVRRQQALLELIQYMKENPEDVLYSRRQKFMRTDIWPNPLLEKEDLDMPFYYLSKIVDLLRDSYSSDSGVFDLTEGTAELKYLRERLLDEEVCNKQYLVPVDFHF